MAEPVADKNPLLRKLTRLRELSLDADTQLLQLLKYAAPLIPENNLRARQKLRASLERQSLETSQELLKMLSNVRDTADTMCGQISQLNGTCQRMSTDIRSARIQAGDVLLKAAALKGQFKTLNEKGEVLDNFLATYQLKPEELSILQSPISAEAGSTISADFFAAFTRLRNVRASGRQLLRDSVLTAGSSEGMAPQRTALELMEFVATLEESAFDKLYRWVQVQCRSLSADCPDPPSKSLVDGLCLLSERPILLQCCIDEYITVRRMTIVRVFIDALTRGDVVAGSKPIELQAHDRVRYCSDVLAWVHQALLLERDCLMSLLGKVTPEARTVKVDGCPDKDIGTSALSNIVDGVCRPLSTRLEQVLSNETDPFVLYLVLNILKFYTTTFDAVVRDCQLCKLLNDIEDAAMIVFNSCLAIRIANLLENFDVTSDLLPPNGLKSAAKLMKDLVAAVKRNPFAAAAAILPDSKAQSSSPEEIITAIARPFIAVSCALISKKNDPPSPTKQQNSSQIDGAGSLFDNSDKLAVAVFVTNCLQTLKSAANQAITGQQDPGATSQFGEDFFREEIEQAVECLADCLTASALKLSGLQPMLEKLRVDEKADIDESTFSLGFNTFDNLLQSGADLLMSMPVRQLLAPQPLVDRVRSMAIERFLAKYRMLYENLTARQDKVQFVNDGKLKSPEEIAKLIV